MDDSEQELTYGLSFYDSSRKLGALLFRLMEVALIAEEKSKIRHYIFFRVETLSFINTLRN